jgi:hypothetical protein
VDVLRSRGWELAAFSGIVALGAWLRLRGLDLMEFKDDEAMSVDLARRLLDGSFPSGGLTSSTGALNPPLFVYLTAIPLGLSDDPIAAAVFVAVLATVAIALTYVVVRTRLGFLAAAAAAGLFATAPWAVLYGRKIWPQDLLPVFETALLLVFWLILERPRSRAAFFVPVLLCIAFQLNFSALGLAVPVVVLLACRARSLDWWSLGVGVAVAAVLLAPWLVHEVTHGFKDVVDIVTEGRGRRGSAAPGAASLKAVRQTVHLSGASGWDYVLGSSGHRQFVADAGWAWRFGRAASVLAAGLFALGLLTSAVHVVKGARRRVTLPWLQLDARAGRRALLLVWLAGVWLSYATSAPSLVYPHYLIVAYPIPFIVQGLGASDLVGFARARARPFARLAAVTGLVLVLAGFVAFTVAFHRFLDRHGGAAGDYGVVYRDKAALARAVRRDGLRVANEPVIDFLVTGRMSTVSAARPAVTVRDRLQEPAPLPCTGKVRSFGQLSACFPPRTVPAARGLEGSSAGRARFPMRAPDPPNDLTRP